MRYQPLPPSFHTANRRRLSEQLGPDAVAVIDTADVITRVGDFEYPYRPDSNFYYLTGIDQPEAVLVLVPGHPNPDARELLFIRETDSFMAQWEGEGHAKETAAELSGIKTVLWLSDFKRLLDRLSQKYPVIYSNAEESLSSVMSSPARRRLRRLKRSYPLHQFRSVAPLLDRQRLVKDPVEVDQIKRAIDVTRRGLEAAWKGLRPGVPEYAVEADLTAEFIRGGSSAHAFSPIVAAGKNATVIHYMRNDTVIKDDELVLFDVGAEVGWYAADISRTVPVSGRFTKRQRELYDLVYQTQQNAIKLHKPGTSIFEIDEVIREQFISGLAKLGIFTPAQAKAKDARERLHTYYPHISHQLGMEVHDNPDSRLALEPGMVVTCEPGLYLPDEGLGVRIEDDILITKDGCEVLSREIPADPDQLEAVLRP